VNNLLVASDSYRLPLLRFEQPKALCSRLMRPMEKEIDGNVYVRATVPGEPQPTLVTWSPAPTDSCSLSFTTLDQFGKGASGVEGYESLLDLTPRSVFKGADLGRYDLQPKSGVPKGRGVAPDDVRKLLGWSEQDGQWPGAYPSQK